MSLHTEPKQRRCLMLFAKPPVVGKVKTRLSPAYSPEQATALYARLLERSIATVNAAEVDLRSLWCGFYPQHEAFQVPALSAWQVFEQAGDDLGARMHDAFERSFASSRNVVVMGADAPSIDPAYIEQAFRALEEGAAVVVGPAEDGGYVLLGMSALYAQAFDDIPWGTSQVLALTRQRLAKLGLSLHELDMRWDVDRAEDVLRWLED